MLEKSRHGILLPPPKMSILKMLSTLPEKQRMEFLEPFSSMEIEEMRHDWRFIGRREQLPPPGDWEIWFSCAGAGSGKTRTLTEYVIHLLRNKIKERVGFIAPTINSLWRTNVYGPDGFIAIAPKDFQPELHRQDRVIRWPNGGIINLITSEEPDQLRGPSTDMLVFDEMAAMCVMSDPKDADDRLDYLWALARQRLRHQSGHPPETVIATTPRPRRLVKKLAKMAAQPEGGALKVVMTTGSTFDNEENLPGEYVRDMRETYAGTRLGQQEVYGKILEEISGSLFTFEMIERARIDLSDMPEMKRIVVGVDPAISSHKDSNLTGIVAAGTDHDDIGYILSDHSMNGSPSEWASKVESVYEMYKADLIVAEKNQGGEMVETTLRGAGKNLPIKLVTATRGKIVRAEPVAALFERNMIKIVGSMPALEEQMLAMEAGKIKRSPDSIDAATWAITELMLGENKRRRIGSWKHD